MRKLAMGLCALVLAATAPAFGQNTNAGSTQINRDRLADFRLSAAGTCTTGASAARLDSTGLATIGVTVTGTFTGTLTFKAAVDDSVTYNTVNALPQAGGAAVTTATSTGTWFVTSAAGYKWFCLYFSSYSSGTAVVHLQGSTNGQGSLLGANITQIGGASLALGAAADAASIPVTISTTQMLAQNSTTSGQLGMLHQGATTTAAPSYTTAKTNPLSLTTAGGLRSDLASVGGTTLAFGSAVSASSIPVVIASDQAAVAVKGAAADGASISGSPVPIGVKAVGDAAAPTQVTTGQVAYPIATLERIPIVSTRHPNHIQCQQVISTATSLTAMGGSCATPGAGLSIYITDIDFSTNAAGISADSFNTLKSGTGGTCGAATAVIWQCMTAAATQATCSSHLQTPIKVTANSEVCWINSTAGSKTVNLEGYIAP